MNWSIFSALVGLTFRQVATVRRTVIVALLVTVPIVGSVLLVYFDLTSETATVVYDLSIFATVMPIVTLVVASPVFSDEIEDRTLPILALTPIPRWQLVLPKWATAFAVAVVPVAISAFVSAVIGSDASRLTSAIAVTAGAVFGCLCYTSLFAFLGTITGRAVVIGLIYIVAWEALFASIIPSLNYVSIGQFAIAIAAQIEPNVLPIVDGQPDFTDIPAVAYSAVAGLTVVAVCGLAGIWRLRSMDIN